MKGLRFMAKIGDKFVIEIDDISKSSFYYRIKGVEIFVTQSDLDKLEKLSCEEESKKFYKKGLNDAWNLIKKIDSDIPWSALESIFGRDVYDRCDGTISDIIGSCTIEEVIGKIEDWERKKNEIKVGD